MAKYRKTALVEAEQFLPPHQIPAGVFQAPPADAGTPHVDWVLETLEGHHVLRAGDYICTGPAGERWNVERTIFEATYELATPAADKSGDVERLREACCGEYIAGSRCPACPDRAALAETTNA